MVRGEIWWADLPKPKKSEPGFRRPVLIIQADSFNKSKIKTMICCIITSNIEQTHAPGNVLLEKLESHLPKKSVINVSQIITIDPQDHKRNKVSVPLGGCWIINPRLSRSTCWCRGWPSNRVDFIGGNLQDY